VNKQLYIETGVISFTIALVVSFIMSWFLNN
jgi:hypothetical protein